ncbi:MAG: hypothetical protein PWQ09_1397 [Candidatus Cloacimonadota bacterium]|jgi:PAS domain S-box-containing protein|nr:hypothetical protein [Candidatus Cloacimonadota bacterium]
MKFDDMNILLVDDNKNDRALVKRQLKNEFKNINVLEAGTHKDFQSILEHKYFHLAIVDYQLKWSNGLEVVHNINCINPECSIIMFTATGSEEIAVKVMKSGIDDYIIKSLENLVPLLVAVRTALKTCKERISYEKSLIVTEQNYKKIFETAANLIISIDKNGYIVDCNQRVKEYLGYQKSELLGKNMTLIYHPDDHRKIKKNLKNIIKRGVLYNEYYKMVRKDGSEFKVKVNSSRLTDASGNFIRTICLIEDITSQIETVEALQQSEEKFRNIFQKHSAVKLLLDPETGRIVDANDAAASFYGWSTNELKQMNINQINTLPPEKIKQEMQKAKQKNKVKFEFKHKKADGIVVDVAVYSSKINIQDKDYLHSIIIDITKEKRQQKIQEVQTAISQAALKANDLSSLSRAIQTNLNKIIDAHNFMIATYDEKNHELDFIYKQSQKDEYKKFPLGKTLTNYVITNKQPLLANKDKINALEATGEVKIIGHPTKLWLGIPLLYREKVVGVMSIQSFEDEHAFDETDINMLQNISNQLANVVLRQQAQVELRNREQLYRLLANNAIDPIWKMTMDGKFTYVNPSIQNLTGYSPEEWIGSNIFEHIGKKELPVVQNLIKTAIENRPETFTYQIEIYHKDGHKVNVEFSGRVIEDSQRNPIEIQGLTRDISERLEYEKKLKYRAKQFQLINEVSKEVSEFLEPQKLMEKATTLITKLFEYENVSILLLSGDSTTLNIKAGSGKMKDFFRKHFNIPVTEGITGWVACNGRAAIVGDTSKDKRFINPYKSNIITKSELTVPLVTSNRTWGVLDCQSSKKNAFQKNDLETLQTLAGQIASALENAELYQRTQQELRERTRMQQALETSERKARAIIDANKDFIMMLDEDFTILDLNLELLKYIKQIKNQIKTKDDLIGKNSKELISKDNFKIYQKAFKKAMRTGQIINYRVEIKQKHYAVTLYPLRKGKETKNLVFSACDITKSVREQMLRTVIYNISNAVNETEDLAQLLLKIREYLGRIIDTKNFYVAMYNEETNTISLPYHQDTKDNIDEFPAGKTLTAYVINHNTSLFLKQKEIEEMRNKGIIEIIGTLSKVWMGVPLKIENKIIGVVSVQSYENENAYTQKDREVLEFVSEQIALAITRKKNQDELRRTYEQLKQLNKDLQTKVDNTVQQLREKDHLLIMQSRQAAMGEMIGNIAHQWRQPLTAVSAIVQDIEDAWEYNELDAAYLNKSVNKAMEQLQFMSRTIDDFRNFFQPNKEKANFNAKDIIEKTISFISKSFVHNQIKLEANLEDVTIYGFENEYSQVVLNILNNAKDAIKENNVHGGTVKLELTKNNGASQLVICDDGGGIPQKNITRIFDPYFTTKEQGKGTGIGLYMSKMIVENNMGGKIEAYNVKAGACFKVTV